MASQDIIAELTNVFRDVLDLPELVLKSETTAADVPEWDSLSHVQLVVAVERHFKIKFDAREIRGFKNIGDMSQAIRTRLGA